MKPTGAVAKSLLMAASIGVTMPLTALYSRAQSRPPTQTNEDESEIVGISVARADGTFLGFAVEDLALVMRFYDKDKKAIPADVARATVWWDPVNKAGKVRTVMNPAPDGLSLQSLPKLRPPYVYQVVVTVIDAQDKAGETYFVDLKDLP